MIVGIGLVNKDIVAVVPSWERDTKVTATHFWEQVGGPVPVALQTIARLGYVPPSFDGPFSAIRLLSVTGSDQTAHDLRGTLDRWGVETHWCPLGGKNKAASVSLVLLDAHDGSRTVANYAEELPPLNLSRLSAQRDILARTRLLHLDGRDLPASLEAARIVRENGGTVSLDLGTMRPGRDQLFRSAILSSRPKKAGRGHFPNTLITPRNKCRVFLITAQRLQASHLARAVLSWGGAKGKAG